VARELAAAGKPVSRRAPAGLRLTEIPVSFSATRAQPSGPLPVAAFDIRRYAWATDAWQTRREFVQN